MFDVNALLEQIKNPIVGLQILAVLTVFNVLLGIVQARKAGSLNRELLNNFLWTRGVEQLLPIAAAGLASVYGNMPWLLAIYVAGASFMLYDLTGDIKDKSLSLWKRQG